jgi:antitoxin (DNA-binding transcriptional repressor) of toxin-antitoxin stability system
LEQTLSSTLDTKRWSTPSARKIGNRLFIGSRKNYFMKIENVRTAKATLNRLISDLPRSGSVIITKNGKPCAALMPITEDTDLEVLPYLRTSASGRSLTRPSRVGNRQVSLTSMTLTEPSAGFSEPTRSGGVRIGEGD